MSRWPPNSSLSQPIRSMISSRVVSFPAGKSVENGSPPGTRCCAGSRVHRKTIHLPGPSNAVIGVSSPTPSKPARRRLRKGKPRLSCPLPYYNIKLLIILSFLTRKPPSVYTWYVQYLDYSWILPCERMSMTTKTIHISLPESLKEYMDERVAEEHYSTFSDYIRALVREDQKRHTEERLEKLLIEGLESGRGAEYGSQEWDKFWERIHSRINKAREKKSGA